jgi:hypothetical protein
MDALKELLNINVVTVILGIFILMSAFNTAMSIIEKFSEKIGKPVKWIKKRQADHELIIKNTEAIKELSERHNQDTQQSIEHDQKIEKELSGLIDEIKNEIHSYEVSRDKQIAALMCGSKELLGDTIDQRYSRYISLGGIPENEVAEFDDIYVAYKGLNGNHTRDTKYSYVKNHLPVIPVETKLVVKDEK